MARKEKDFDTINDGSHAIRKFNIVDFLIIVILVILCLTCVLPFIHLAAKSVSSNTAVMQKSVVLWPKGLNFEAYISSCSLPHVSGGVSPPIGYVGERMYSSPHPWGCFTSFVRRSHSGIFFPTSVGVFLRK